MNRTSPSEVKSWCIDRGFHPNKVLGQNFLIDRNILTAIVEAVELSPQAKVLEVGPGLGVMTEALLERGCHVTAVEKDPILAQWLQESLVKDYPQTLDLTCADALEVPLEPLLAQGFEAFMSNLPYSVGTRILMEIIQQPNVPDKLVTLVQTEVAERFAAKENTDARGVAGIWLQLDYDVTSVRTVAPTCFWPKPEVMSTIVAMRRHSRSTLTQQQKATCRALVKLCFLHRRKQLGTLLRKAPAPFTLPDAAERLTAVGLMPERRPETLTIAEWEVLTREVYS